ncbi:hypothetical protein BCV70DRAFT_28425, partial [Testicularia cyperi]
SSNNHSCLSHITTLYLHALTHSLHSSSVRNLFKMKTAIAQAGVFAILAAVAIGSVVATPVPGILAEGLAKRETAVYTKVILDMQDPITCDAHTTDNAANLNEYIGQQNEFQSVPLGVDLPDGSWAPEWMCSGNMVTNTCQTKFMQACLGYNGKPH